MDVDKVQAGIFSDASFREKGQLLIYYKHVYATSTVSNRCDRFNFMLCNLGCLRLLLVEILAAVGLLPSLALLVYLCRYTHTNHFHWDGDSHPRL